MRIIFAAWVLMGLFIVSRTASDRTGALFEVQCGRAEQQLDIVRGVSVSVPIRCAEEYAADVAAQFAYNPNHAALVGVIGFLFGLALLWVLTVLTILLSSQQPELRRLDLLVGLITMIGIGGIAIGVVGSNELADQLSRIGVLGSPAMILWVSFALAAATGYGMVRIGVNRPADEHRGPAQPT
jgi:hypothetical protein